MGVMDRFDECVFYVLMTNRRIHQRQWQVSHSSMQRSLVNQSGLELVFFLLYSMIGFDVINER